MQLSDFDYDLPAELIAQQPLKRRDASRMLIVDRAENSFEDRQFYEFENCLGAGDVLVINNTKVFPARLKGRTDTGASVEIFLIREIEGKPNRWEALAKPLRRLQPGKRIIFADDAVCHVVDMVEAGRVVVEFEFAGSDLYSVLEDIGRTPLPPYIRRSDEDERSIGDRERYQTVYANATGAIAAPTAGLHFTPEVLYSIKERGVTVVEITLHVGYGTFEPVRVENLAEHRVLSERYSISEEAAEILNRARTEDRRIVAVGTTTTRALEHAIAANGNFVGGQFLADLTITPGYKFRAVGALLTNFHLPKSSLLILVSTFAGHDLAMRAYRHAVESHYRFYSYGDCMFIY